MSIPAPRIEEARALVRGFTLLAAATGAVPSPGASGALILENAAMFAAVGGTLGVPVTVESVLTSVGLFGSLNMAGRQLFVEGAKLLGWATGPLGLPALCAWGAATAAGQTWALGQLAIAIARNGGGPLSPSATRKVLDEGLAEFSSDRWRAGRVVMPGRTSGGPERAERHPPA